MSDIEPKTTQTDELTINLVADPLLEGIAEAEKAVAGLLRRTSPSVRVGRNDPCPCQSGRKFKACCIKKARK